MNRWFIMAWNVEGALISPIGMTTYSKRPYLQRKVLKHMSGHREFGAEDRQENSLID